MEYIDYDIQVLQQSQLDFFSFLFDKHDNDSRIDTLCSLLAVWIPWK